MRGVLDFDEAAVGFDACDGGSMDGSYFGRYETSPLVLLIAHDNMHLSIETV